MPGFPNENPPTTPSLDIETTIYNDFQGVDYVHDAYTCAKNRCPELINMWSPTRGVLESRNGFKTQRQFAGKINAIAYGYLNGMKTFVHEGTNLWVLGDTDEKIFSGLADAKSIIFFDNYMKPFLIPPEIPVEAKTIAFVLDGTNYYYIDYVDNAFVVEPVENIATIPVVTIAGSSIGGGTTLQPINLLQPGRTSKVYGDEVEKIFQLPFKELDAKTVEIIEITDTGEETYTENASGDLGFTVDRELGKITFNKAPPKPPVEGTDNIYITAYKTVEGYADKVKKCTQHIQYGKGGALRAFVTRNPEYRAYDWWSEPQDATYFPDLNYGISGNDNTAIIGYMIFQSTLILVKESNGSDITLYARTPQITEEKTYFLTDIGGLSLGAISPYAFANILDEPLFLTKDGVFSLVSDVISQRATLQNRSYWIDPVLIKEPNLSAAVAVEWKGHYFVSVNGHTYILDGRQGETIDRQKTNVYNAYFWNGYSPVCYCNINNELYFGTADGKVCKFTEDYTDDENPIDYLVATKQDDDGNPMYRKTMQKKGNSIALKPYRNSEVEIYLKTNFGTQNEENPFIMGASTFDFNLVDFKRISFKSNTFTQPKRLPIRVKKYETLQFVLKSTGLPFAVVAIAKSFTLTRKPTSY